MHQTCSNMFQIDNVTNNLKHGLINDHRFEDMALSRVKQIYTTFLNNLGYYKHIFPDIFI